MGLFKNLNEKPYTKADYYREMEERAAAKMAAKAAPVIVVPVKEPEWLEPEIVPAVETEEVVVPFVEAVVSQPQAVAEEKTETLVKEINVEPSDFTSALPKEKTEAVKIAKNKRKKSG